MAKTMGFKTEASLAKKAGSEETRGVIRLRSPKAAIMTTTAYGVQIPAHRHTLVMATLAILISALWALASLRKKPRNRPEHQLSIDR